MPSRSEQLSCVRPFQARCLAIWRVNQRLQGLSVARNFDIFIAHKISQTTIPDLDSFLESLASVDVAARPTSKEASSRLSDLVNTRPPVSLLIAGDVQDSMVKRLGHELGWD